jgi:hypothetical protein
MNYKKNNHICWLNPYMDLPRQPYKDENLYKDGLMSKVQPYNLFDDYFKKINLEMSDKEMNSFNYRCEEFKKIHEGLHIVFSGCSYTFGSSILFENVWAKQTYNLFSKNQKVSGYFNLGVPGSGVMHQVIDFFKYCKTYGNPDIFIINLPDMMRFYSYNVEKKEIRDGFYDLDMDFRIITLLSYQYYYMLDQYCNTNNIKLFSFTWTNSESKQEYDHFKLTKIDKFKTFYKYEKNNLLDFVKSYKIDNPNDMYAEMARDNVHRGNAYNTYWANFIYSKYLETL